MKNPYPGLRPFRQNESHLFFGRDGQTDEILARLGREHFVAIVGVSGCGKSSLINAGLFPGLHGGLLPTGQREWRIARLQPRKPQDDPIRNLASALLEANVCAVEESSDPASLVEGVLSSSARGLREVVRGSLSAEGPDKTALLVVVDQFEEIFARSGTTAEAAQFVQLLLEAVPPRDRSDSDERPLPLYIALAMRSDFLGDCAIFPGLPERINNSQYLVPRMSLLEREDAIARPAATEGIIFARPLLDRLLDDLGDDPDQLPILQHSLQRTWEAWLRRTEGKGNIELQDYLAPEVGGMAGAISNHAEEAFAALGPAKEAGKRRGPPVLVDLDGLTFTRQQHLAGALFRCITEQAEDRRAVRRPLALGRVAKIANVSVAEMGPVVDAFRNQQRSFVTPAEGVPLDADRMVDISHESLIRNWPRLGHWARQESLAAAELLRLRQSAIAFRRGNQDPLDRLELMRVERWQKGLDNALLAVPEIVPSAEWARLYLGDEAPEAFAEIQDYIAESQERRRLRRRRKRFALLSLATILVLLAGFLLLWLIQSETEKARDAASRLAIIEAFAKTADRLRGPIIANAGAAQAQAEQQTEKLIAAIAKAATEEPPDPGLIEEQVEEQVRTREAAAKAADAMDALAQSITTAAEVTKDKALSETANNLAVDARALKERGAALEKSEAGVKALRSSVEARLDHAERALTGLIKVQPLDPTVVNARKDDIAAAEGDFTVLAALEDAAEAFKMDEKGFSDFLPRFQAVFDTLFAIASMEVVAPTALSERDANSAVALKHDGKVNRVRFASLPGQLVIAVACEDSNVWLWETNGELITKIATGNSVNDVAVSPRGDAIAAASNGNTVRVVRSDSPNFWARRKVTAFERHAGSITDVEFSHGGDRIASASADRTVRVFDSRSMAQLYFTSPPLPDVITSVEFHRGDNLLVSGCDDGGVRLHTIDQPAVQLLGKFGAPAHRPEFSPDGKLVVAASGDKTVRIWPIRADYGIAPVRLEHPAPVNQAIFRRISGGDADSYSVATCCANGEVRVFQLLDLTKKSSGYRVSILEPRHSESVLSVAESVDGRWLATVGGGEVLVWEWTVDLPVARLRLRGLPPGISRAEFSPDGKLLVTYGGDVTAHLWDLTRLLPP